MKTKTHLLLILLLCANIQLFAQEKWYNPMDSDNPYICGRAWNKETGKTFNRLPDRMKALLPQNIWELSKQTAGLSIRFTTNSKNITVKYQTSFVGDGYRNLTALNHSGVDLYAMDVHGGKHWIGSHMQWNFNKDSVTISYRDITNNTFIERGLEYELYLPGYNGIKTLKIGVDNSSSFKFLHQSEERPIVIYGSSIVQGASPSRPGLMFANTVARELDYPVVNLGFSGSALMEPSVFDVISEIDAKAFIIDPIPNCNMLPKDEIISRALAGIKKIRSKSQAPILMVESCMSPDSIYNNKLYQTYVNADNSYHEAYKQLVKEGVKNLYYMPHSDIKFSESSMIEGTHPNDIGNRQYADAYEKKIGEMLSEDHASKRFPPVRQRRDGSYEWLERHNQVIERNHTINPEILMIGNSITHYWGGEPKSNCNGGEEWNRLFGKRRVTNMGFGWDRIENVYWRIFHGELDGCHPKHICLLIGINNLGQNGTLDEIAQGISDLAQLIRERQPQAKLHVIKVYPARGRETDVAKLNVLISQKLKTDSHTDIVDITSRLTLNDGSGKIDPACFLSDGLHPNVLGYHKIGQVLKNYLK